MFRVKIVELITRMIGVKSGKFLCQEKIMKMCLDWCIYKDNIFVYIVCVCKFKIYTCKGERTFTG